MKFTPRQLWGIAGAALTALVLLASAADAWPKVVGLFPWTTETELADAKKGILDEMDKRKLVRDQQIVETVKPIKESIDRLIVEQQRQGGQIREMNADRVTDRVSNLEVQIQQLQTSIITVDDALVKDPTSNFLRQLRQETQDKINDLRRKYERAECDRLNLLRVTPRPC